MSYPLDTNAQDAALDALFGDGAAAGIPTSWEVALFAGDPANGGVELSGGGYARVTIANDSARWPDASGGEKTSTAVTFATSSGAWSGPASHFLLIDAADHSTQWFPGVLGEQVVVSAAGAVVRPTLSVSWNTVSNT